MTGDEKENVAVAAHDVIGRFEDSENGACAGFTGLDTLQEGLIVLLPGTRKNARLKKNPDAADARRRCRKECDETVKERAKTALRGGETDKVFCRKDFFLLKSRTDAGLPGGCDGNGRRSCGERRAFACFPAKTVTAGKGAPDWRRCGTGKRSVKRPGCGKQAGEAGYRLSRRRCTNILRPMTKRIRPPSNSGLNFFSPLQKSPPANPANEKRAAQDKSIFL